MLILIIERLGVYKLVYVTKRIEFSASHRLFNPEFTDEENDQIYDKCNNYHGHGHNYILEVTISGEPDPKTGYLIDLKKLKKILMEELINKVDHKHLNFDVPFMKGIIPTVENIISSFWNILADKIPSGKLYRLKLWETENSYAEYFG
jgi:6-pyruvoyltetrahydropterin/6-carboxytetrahydropterin synthase